MTTESPEVENVDTKLMTLDALQNSLNAIEEKIDVLWESGTFSKLEEERQKLTQEFIDSQLENKDGYKNIFMTEHGSIYFALATGESVRIKRTNDKWEMQPICHKIFYVDEEESVRIKEMRKSINFQEEILGTPISTVDCGEGRTPIEFGILHMPTINYVEEPNKIVIKGDHMGVFASGIHMGDLITEVIK